MIIDDLLKRKLLIKQKSSEEEINDLLKIVERDIKDSKTKTVSLDWQFGIAYNAALKLANILVRASGYRVKGHGHHQNVISLIPNLLETEDTSYRNFLDACRKKRNIAEYDYIDVVSQNDIDELHDFIKEFQTVVFNWLKKQNI